MDGGQRVGADRAEGAGQVQATYWLVTLEIVITIYAVLLVSGSIVIFIMSATSDRVGELIADQNASALKLWSNLAYYRDHHGEGQPSDASLPPGLFETLVEFSRNNGEIIKTVHRLRIENVFSRGSSWDTMATYLNHVGALDGREVQFDHYGVDPHTDTASVVTQGFYQIELYQAIRDYALDQANFDKWFLGAITTYVLPVAYALLGSFLQALRSSSRQAQKTSGISLLDRSSRFSMAAIAGIAIGLFSSLLPNNILLSPLALAFLAGYSIDVFTSRLDGLIESLMDRT